MIGAIDSAGAVGAVRPEPTLEELLAPIAGDDPTGASLRYDVVHDEIRELRREDDPTLPQGVWRHELKRADWNGIARLTSEALRSRSKDLQMATWLAEAWVRLDGLAGLERGIELVTGLIERYGQDIHPRVEDDADDPALRLAALGRLEGALPEALLWLPMTRPRGEEGEVRAWGDWKRALYLENLRANHPEAAAEAGGLSREGFLASAGLTPDGFYLPLAERTERCRTALGHLATLADERYGRDAPGFTVVREELEAIGRLARRLAADRGETAAAETPAAAEPLAAAPPTEIAAGEEDEMTPPNEPAADPAAPAPGAASGTAAGELPCRITTRAEAYRALDQAAELLLRIEPHSPVPYLVKRAVRWGHLSLSELYAELFQIADPNAVFKLLGIQKETE